MRALWNGQVIAESEVTVVVEGNHYFPSDTVAQEYLVERDTTSTCYWKGKARYYSVVVDGQESTDAAWYYPEPSEAASEITGYVAFSRGVIVQ